MMITCQNANDYDCHCLMPIKSVKDITTNICCLKHQPPITLIVPLKVKTLRGK